MSVATAPHVPGELLDAVALVEVLSDAIDEDLLAQLYEEVIVPAQRYCYGELDPDLDDETYGRLLVERDRPHDRRVEAWRDRLRGSNAVLNELLVDAPPVIRALAKALDGEGGD